MKKHLATLLTAVLCAVCLTVAANDSVSAQERNKKFVRSSRKIQNRYIVVLQDSVNGDFDASSFSTAAANDLRARYGGKVDQVFRRALRGYTAEMSEAEAEAISQDPRVKFVEEDSIVYANATQTGATWGLDRIDQRDRPTNGNYVYNATGNNVNAYIVDTGIRTSHNEFGGRAVAGFDAVGDGQNAQDCNGHGTHVAGTVGGATYGVAKNARLYAVRVLGCDGSGSNSGVIAGVDWVANNHVKPAVANMSLGGGASSALDNAVQNAISAGVTFVVAAGNDNANACNYSPARAANAITVGSTTSSDARSSFSNFGSCVDIFAPGSSITSAWYTSNSATSTISGTSMASPHVAGVAALYLEGNPSASPATVANGLTSTASSGKISSIGTGSPNLLLYSLLTGGGTTPPPPPPPTCSGGSYSGTLSGTGASAIQPNGSYYQSTTSGVHGGTLTDPAGADFDLYLQKWNGSSWSTVARAETANATETISYNGTAGYYRWRVYSYSGSGAYTLCTTRP